LKTYIEKIHCVSQKIDPEQLTPRFSLIKLLKFLKSI
jgi:hypothetical protein